MRKTLLSACAVLLFAAPAFADTIDMPPAGTTVINLSATERATLPQDQLNATLRIEQEGPSAKDIQDKINKTMAQAAALAKTYDTVKTSTGGYYVYQYDDGKPDPKTGQIVNPVKKWRGSQTIQLESKDSTNLLDLAGKIQGMGFVMDGLDYSLSTQQADSVHDDLMAKALKSLGDKAKIAQTALGKGSYDILEVNVDSAAPPVYPMYKAMAMRADAAGAAPMPTPTAVAGETDVTLNVSARVLLKP